MQAAKNNKIHIGEQPIRKQQNRYAVCSRSRPISVFTSTVISRWTGSHSGGSGHDSDSAPSDAAAFAAGASLPSPSRAPQRRRNLSIGVIIRSAAHSGGIQRSALLPTSLAHSVLA
uniref:Uncharacterized protein n=1 Tax=Plectus sambesii TaxID=2011161 RepID=A0A914XK38_9BILA